jgi:hypothetical protein
MAVGANKAAAEANGETASGRRIKYGLSVGILLLSAVIILGVLNWLASDAAARFDLTARGRYSISRQTLNLLDSLDDTVTITMLFGEQDPTLHSDQQRTVAAQRREVEDVLRELRNKSDKIEVVRIDPTDPRTITRYDSLIEKLQTIFKDESDTYLAAVQEGRVVLDRLAEFGTVQSEALIDAVGGLSPERADFRMFQSIIQLLAGAPREVESVNKSIDESLEASPMTGAPFPDLVGAVSIVRAAAQMRGPTMTQIADFFQQSLDEGSLPETVATRLRGSIQSYRDTASALLDLREKIDDLEPLELTSINSALRSRNCVLLTTSTRATVLPYGRLFPPPSAQQAADEGAGALRKFAGETVLASGIRQLTLTERPNVILCHAEQAPSILMGQPGRTDLTSVAEQLRDLGFEVQEWNVNQGPRPVLSQTVGEPVWVIVPPAPSGQIAMAGGALANTARDLVAEGASVLIGFYPSFIPSIGQTDPWNAAIEPLGVAADSARLVIEKIPGPNGQDQFAATHDFVDYLGDHPISTAVRGEPTQLDLVVPLQVSEKPNVRHSILLELTPGDRLWATDQWQGGGLPEPPETPDVAPYPIVVTAERTGTSGLQRMLIVGSARWCWTSTVGRYDFTMGLPMYPGNGELFASGVCWLAHLDELIARSPRAESVARIENLGSGAQIFWRWALIGGLPVLSLIAGIFVAISRRG